MPDCSIPKGFFNCFLKGGRPCSRGAPTPKHRIFHCPLLGLARSSLPAQRWYFLVCLVFCLLVIGLATSARSKPDRVIEAGQADSLWLDALDSAADQIKTRDRILALCDLAQKAAFVFPGLALELARQALLLECSQEKSAVASLARELRKLNPEGLSPQQDKLLNGLESRTRAAWRFRLIGQTVQALQPEFSLTAYDFALRTCLANPDVRQRDAELVELAVLLARLDRWKAWVLIRLIKQKTAKVRAMRLVAGLGNSWFEMGCALALARTISEPVENIKALNGIAKNAGMWDKDSRSAVCSEAFDLAKNIGDKNQRARLLGRVAAQAALIDPYKGLDLAMAMDSMDGAAFEAFFQAAVGLEVLDPVQAGRAWLLAWDQVGHLGGETEKAMALSRIVRAVSGVDSDLAGEVLRSWPKGEFLARAEAEAALALSMAGKNLAAAIDMAERIIDQVVRLRTLARLAGAPGYDLQRIGRESLPEKVLIESGNLKEPETGLLLIPAVAAISPARAVGLIQQINEPGNRAKGLIRLSRILWHQGRDREAVNAINMALWEINCIKSQQTLDNVRILGDMGRGWALIDPGEAKKVFLLGVQTAYK